jgi:hypothetical protein
VDIKSLTADTLKVILTGSGNINLAGLVSQQNVEISGSGSYKAGDLDTQQTTAIISGSGNMTLWVKDSLNITISGSGTVDYYGNPRVNQKMTGSGSINSLGEK